MALVIRAPEAIRDILEAWSFVATNNGEAAADAFVAKIRQKTDALATQPSIGRRRPELGTDVRSLPVDSYLIFYRPIRGGIRVIRLLHGKRDIEAAFTDEEAETEDIPD